MTSNKAMIIDYELHMDKIPDIDIVKFLCDDVLRRL